MKHLLPAIISFFKSHAPLLLVVFTALTIALINIDPSKHYTGWDNIHAEFDMVRYAKQVFFGAWLEHQGPGAPATLAHPSEIPRLPILFLLNLLLPDNLVRYAFIFMMYLVGGVGTYFFLSRYWLQEKLNGLRKWIASLGGVLYLLHVLTLQQFYIAFELFTVQFAFLPFLLIAVHKLSKSITIRSVLWFIVLQLLIAPSGHTPTVFYLGTLLMVMYAYFLKLEKKPLIEAIKFGLIVGLMAFFSNAYWIIPNIHYSLNNAHYVSESRENRLFAPESLYSIRETSSYENFLNSTHYLLTWKDYSIADQEYQYIFDEWLPHLNSESVQFILGMIGRITLLGFFLLLFAKNKGSKRFGIIYMYLIAVIFIWMDMFATRSIFDLLFRSSSFTEAFRNPFTKLSVIYAFVSVLLFAYTFEAISLWIENFKLKKLTGRKVSLFLIGLTIAGIFYSALPSFKGHFLSEVLQVEYPVAYQELFDYLNTRDKDLRILELPQTTQAGWEIYDWSFMGPDNGYQGMGFKFFGIPQPILNRDSDRWVETSDFFYHELKYALDRQNTEQFTELLNKYQVDLILIDETVLNPHNYHDFENDHQLALDAGLEKVWENGFLTIYERPVPGTEDELLLPKHIVLANGSTNRVRKDVIYGQNSDYILSKTGVADFYPFAGIMSPEPTEATFSEQGVVFSKSFPKNYSVAEIPGHKGEFYFTPVEIKYQDSTIALNFPEYVVKVGKNHYNLPNLPDKTFTLDQPNGKIMLIVNNIGIEVEKDIPVYPVLKLSMNSSINVSYLSHMPEDIDAVTDRIQLENFALNWEAFEQSTTIPLEQASKLTYEVKFPVVQLNPTQNPPANCADNQRGYIEVAGNSARAEYLAGDFAVNCAGYVFNYMSSAQSYLLQISGNNLKGRGIKMFIDYSNKESHADQHIFPEHDFHKYLSLSRVSDNPEDKYFLNWETRSFGQESSTILEGLRIAPYPDAQIAGIKLSSGQPNMITNEIEVNSHRRYLESIHLANFKCNSEICFLGLDQSWDKLWVAVPLHKPWTVLPHFRLNNWANVWQLSGEGTVAILYIPQLLSTASILLLSGAILYLVYLVYQSQGSTRYKGIKAQLTRSFQG